MDPPIHAQISGKRLQFCLQAIRIGPGNHQIKVGMRRGNTLYVGYHTLDAAGPGLVRYEVQDGKLVGTYLTPDARSGIEELERVK
jgi:hypothetical protein